MTGWELHAPNEDLLAKRFKNIKAFLKEYPLATNKCIFFFQIRFYIVMQ